MKGKEFGGQQQDVWAMKVT